MKHEAQRRCFSERSAAPQQGYGFKPCRACPRVCGCVALEHRMDHHVSSGRATLVFLSSTFEICAAACMTLTTVSSIKAAPRSYYVAYAEPRLACRCGGCSPSCIGLKRCLNCRIRTWHACVHLLWCWSVLLRAELLPLLEKFSKTCILLLRPESVHFILRAVDSDGMHMSAECSKASRAPHHAVSARACAFRGLALLLVFQHNAATSIQQRSSTHAGFCWLQFEWWHGMHLNAPEHKHVHVRSWVRRRGGRGQGWVSARC